MRKIAGVLFSLLIMVPIFALRIGDPAPFFKIRDLSGKEWKLSRLIANKKTVVLVFFSMYCPHCREELPYINKLYNKYAEEGLVVLGICVDRDEPENLRNFRDTVGIKFPLGLDTKNNLLARIYEIEAVPANFFIDKNGKISQTTMGFSKKLAPEIEREIAKLLRN